MSTQNLPSAENIKDQEAEFEERLLMFDREVSEASRHYCAFLTIHHEYATRDEVKELCDSLVFFTSTVLTSLQTAFIIALGRVFDDDSKYTVHKLLALAEGNRSLFSKSALIARMLLQFPDEEPWMDDLMAGYLEPTDDQFATIRRQLKGHRKMYQGKLRPLRHKWLAHREIDSVAANRLFGSTKIKDIEVALNFLAALHEALRDLYFGGGELSISEESLVSKEEKTHPLEPCVVTGNQSIICQQTRDFVLRAAASSTSITQ